MFGGFAFSPREDNEDTPWSAFKNTEFVLPRWSYERDGDRAWVSVFYEANEKPEEILYDVLSELKLRSLRRSKPSEQSLMQTQEEEEPLESWTKRFDKIQNQISDGEIQKIVAARQTRISSKQTFNLQAVLRSLKKRDTMTTHLAFPANNSIFTGASQEN